MMNERMSKAKDGTAQIVCPSPLMSPDFTVVTEDGGVYGVRLERQRFTLFRTVEGVRFDAHLEAVCFFRFLYMSGCRFADGGTGRSLPVFYCASHVMDVADTMGPLVLWSPQNGFWYCRSNATGDRFLGHDGVRNSLPEGEYMFLPAMPESVFGRYCDRLRLLYRTCGLPLSRIQRKTHIDCATFLRLRNGEGIPSDDVTGRLARVFGVSSCWLKTGKPVCDEDYLVLVRNL